MTALKLGGTEAKILTLTVVQEEEWQLCASEKEIPEMPELPFKIPGVWAEDSPPPNWLRTTSSGSKIKTKSYPVSQNQYYIPRKAQIRIQNYLHRLLKYGSTHTCQSSALPVSLEHSLIACPKAKD
jgi:hypothetical protein